MFVKRIIPCLDVCRGRVVKGINFENLRDAGDPVEMAVRCSEDSADELVLLNIDASADNKVFLQQRVKEITSKIPVPLTVGGGIGSLRDIQEVLEMGAAKVSISTAAIKNPRLIAEAAKKFGSRRIVVAVDVCRRRRNQGGWDVYIKGGSLNTGKDVLKWIAQAEVLGAGEVLLTSMDRDGTRDGYDIELVRSAAESVSIPIIASGGAGDKEHILEVLTKGKADAALAASLFHFNKLTIPDLKDYLSKKGVPVKK